MPSLKWNIIVDAQGGTATLAQFSNETDKAFKKAAKSIEQITVATLPAHERAVVKIQRQYAALSAQIDSLVESKHLANDMATQWHEALGVRMQEDLDNLKTKGESTFLSLGNTAMGFLKSRIVWTGFEELGKILSAPFTDGMKAVEDYRLNVASLTAMITTFSQKGKDGDLAGAFRDANQYAQAMIPALETLSAKVHMSGQDLISISQIFAQHGVLLDINNQKQMQDFQNIVMALKMTSGGMNEQGQIQASLNNLLEGNIIKRERLPAMLQNEDNLLKQHIQQAKENGTIYEYLGSLTKGIGQTSGLIADTWATIGTTLKTTAAQVLRGGMGGAYEDLLSLAQDINSEFKNQDGTITKLGQTTESSLYKGWQDIKNAVSIVYDLLKPFAPLLEVIGKLTALAVDGWGQILAIMKGVVQRASEVAQAMEAVVKGVALSVINPKAAAEEFSKATSLWFTGGREGGKAYVSGLKAEIDQALADYNTKKGSRNGMVSAPGMAGAGADTTGQRKAQEQYTQYLKAQKEAEVAVIKAANDQKLALDKNAYDWGLMDLTAYLAEKHRLNEASLAAELQAKRQELTQARSMVGVVDVKKSPAEQDAERNQSLVKVANAQKAVIEAENKLALARISNAEETKKLNFDTLNSYKTIQAQYLDMEGDYVAAAAIHQRLDEASIARKKMEADAAAGNAEAKKADQAAVAIDQEKANQAVEKRIKLEASLADAKLKSQQAQLASGAKLNAINPDEAAEQRISLLAQERDLYQGVYDSIKGNSVQAQQDRQAELDKIDAINVSLREQQKILADRTAIGGFKNALQDYQKAAADTGAMVKNATTNVFKSMGDALTNFVTTGKINFKNFADSIIADFARIAIEQQVMAPLAGALPGVLGSLFAPTYDTGTPSLAAGQSYSDVYSSGWMPSIGGTFAVGTDYVPQDMIAQLHKGEAVVRASQNPGAMTVNIVNNAGVQVSAQQRNGADGSLSLDVAIERIDNALSQRVAKGRGLLAQTMEGTYGLNRAAGAYR